MPQVDYKRQSPRNDNRRHNVCRVVRRMTTVDRRNSYETFHRKNKTNRRDCLFGSPRARPRTIHQISTNGLCKKKPPIRRKRDCSRGKSATFFRWNYEARESRGVTNEDDMNGVRGKERRDGRSSRKKLLEPVLTGCTRRDIRGNRDRD